MSVAPGTWPEPAIDAISATQFVAISDGANYNCWRMTTSDASFSNVGTICAGSGAKVGLTVRQSVKRELIFEISIAGTVQRYISYNMGVNWNAS
jgi:hypothetical protein